jgi:hypothetical protein
LPGDDQADFIEVYAGALDAATCAALVARFDASGDAAPGAVGSGIDAALKDSRDITISGRPAWADAERALNGAMMSGLMRYLRKYPYVLLAPLTLHQRSEGESSTRLDAGSFADLSDAQLQALIRKTLRPGPINLQRYEADRGGYPYWHCELYPMLGDTNAETLHRTLLWTIYLNDGFSAGETEFLYQQRRVAPHTGALLLAPAAFTHTHRGNMPRGGHKYIATSWVLFQRADAIYAA